MTAFFTIDAATSTTPTKFVDVEEFTRRVNVRTNGDGVYIGYTQTDLHFLIPTGIGTESVDSPSVDIILPANKELWAVAATGAPSIYLFVGETG